MKKRLYWVSWYQPGDDHRPVTYPPPKPILGWWCSGYDANDRSTLCAYVEADNEDDAKAIICQSGAWPEAEDWRFCDERDRVQSSDRFPESDWMKPRLARWSAAKKGA